MWVTEDDDDQTSGECKWERKQQPQQYANNIHGCSGTPSVQCSVVCSTWMRMIKAKNERRLHVGKEDCQILAMCEKSIKPRLRVFQIQRSRRAGIFRPSYLPSEPHCPCERGASHASLHIVVPRLSLPPFCTSPPSPAHLIVCHFCCWVLLT